LRTRSSFTAPQQDPSRRTLQGTSDWGPGEAETIALAREKEAVAGTDDGPAIRCLKVLGLRYTSAVALLLALVEVGDVTPELGLELMTKLERFGRYAPRILEDARGRIGAVRKGGPR
jgi:hypothetical protein